MSQFKSTKTSTMIIIQVLLEIILDKVYVLTVDVFKSCIVIHVVEIYTPMMMCGIKC